MKNLTSVTFGILASGLVLATAQPVSADGTRICPPAGLPANGGGGQVPVIAEEGQCILISSGRYRKNRRLPNTYQYICTDGDDTCAPFNKVVGKQDRYATVLTLGLVPGCDARNFSRSIDIIKSSCR